MESMFVDNEVLLEYFLFCYEFKEMFVQNSWHSFWFSKNYICWRGEWDM